MAQQLVTDFVQTNIPGAYPDVTVQSQPIGLGSSGIITIFGEATGGPSYTQTVLANNVFTPSQLDKVKQLYISGPIVDAFSALSDPSNDPAIQATANFIYISKTNTSPQASFTLASYGLLQDRNYGVQGNSYMTQITSLAAEVAPTVTSGVVPAFGAPLNSASFTIRLNGLAATVVTLSATPALHNSIATLVVELNTVLPAGIVATASLSNPTASFTLTMSPDALAYAKGWGKSFELVDSTPGDLASLALVAGITVSSQEPEIEFSLSNTQNNVNQTLDVTPVIVLSVGYQGTTATLTINQATGMLTTVVTGGSGAALSIPISQYTTIATLAAFIDSQTGYTAVSAPSANNLPTSSLDAVTAIGIASTAASLMPGRIKDALYQFNQNLSTAAVSFTPSATSGLPAPMSAPAFLAGGSQGGTAAVDVLNVIDSLGAIQTNIIVPLFSEDATADIALGLTDPSSTYTIAAVNTGLKNHCIAYSTPKLKRNRIGVMSFWGTYANAKSASQGLSNYRCSLAIQQSTQENSLGVITSFMPWYTAVVAAGMQAGGFYQSICNKLANVTTFTDPSGFSSGDPGDVEDALNAGLLILTQIPGGNLWVSDQTTYGFDSNFVYNSIQAVYDSDILSLDLAASFQSAFVGKSLADVNAADGLSFLAQKMSGYKNLKLIAASSDAPAGWKNGKITISAPTMTVAVEIKLATAIYFIPISISISAVQQSA
jgi:hypothetical protein